MSKKHYVGYEEFIRIGKSMYNKGGDVIVECWDRKGFDEYIAEFGKITARKAYVMCEEYHQKEIDEAGYF